MMHEKMSSMLYEEVVFETKWGEKGKGEIRILGSGELGIATPTSVFSFKDIKNIRRVEE